MVKIKSDTPFDIEIFKSIVDIVSSSPDQLFNFKKYMNFIVEKYPSRILYGLSVLKFSSYQELSKLLSLGNMTYIRRLLAKFIQEGIVTEVKKKDAEYPIITRFWKTIYPNSPHTPIFFKLTSDWERAITSSEKAILRRYNSDEFLSPITIRSNKWHTHYKTTKSQLKELKRKEANSKGRCYQCNRLIMKNEKPGTNYHTFTVGKVCSSCTNKYSHMIGKWRSPNK